MREVRCLEFLPPRGCGVAALVLELSSLASLTPGVV